MNENVEYKKYEIETLSPVHVGNGNALKAFEYLYDKKANTVYFIDNVKWMRLLQRKRLLDSFVEAVSKNRFRGKNVWEWMLAQGVSSAELRQAAASTAMVTTRNLADKRGSLNDIHRNIVNVYGVPYIPGSTIKGALRTGILHAMIVKHKEEYEPVWLKFKGIVKNGRVRKDVDKPVKKLALELEEQVFHQLTMPKGASPMLSSVMRGLSVSDTINRTPEKKSIIVQKIDRSTVKRQEQGLPIFREAIPAGSRLQFSVTMDKAMMKHIGVTSIDEIFRMEKEFIQAGFVMEEKVFGRDYADQFARAFDADMCLGGGTGFLTKSVLYALADTQIEGQDLLKKYFDMVFRIHKHGQLDRKLTPRTIKLASVEGESTLLGLCYLHEVL